MGPDDKKPSLFGRKTPRRNVSMRDYSMPKPYQKSMTTVQTGAGRRRRFRLAMLAGALVASLIAALTILVHDNLHVPRPLPVIKAASPEPPPRWRAPVVKKAGTATAALHSPAPSAPPQRPIAIRHATHPLPRPAPLVFALPAPAATDPDVDLIAAILLLSAAPAAEAQPGCPRFAGPDDPCFALRQIDP